MVGVDRRNPLDVGAALLFQRFDLASESGDPWRSAALPRLHIRMARPVGAVMRMPIAMAWISGMMCPIGEAGAGSHSSTSPTILKPMMSLGMPG